MYEGELRELILRAKQAANQPLAAALAELLFFTQGDAIKEAKCDIIVPVPMHWRRRWQRGVNHAETMSAELGRKLRLPVRRALRRVVPTVPQGGLSAAERQTNVRGAFVPRRLSPIRNRCVLLVDDIVTTGATCLEASRVLRAAGAKDVVLGVISRADRPIPQSRNRL
ncbi:MAG: hypothetical protein MPJ50_07725 [Pirellulales bacterium]|nr:hypothetical protein [Pirellulales bacterium]